MKEGLYSIYCGGEYIDDLHGRDKRDAISKARLLYKLEGYVTAVRLDRE